MRKIKVIIPILCFICLAAVLCVYIKTHPKINNDSMNLKNMKTMVSILNDMNKTNYKIILNEASSRDKEYYNKYDIKNVINKNVNYIIPSNFFIKNIDKYIIEGVILTLSNNIYKRYKDAMKIYNLIVNDILKESKVD